MFAKRFYAFMMWLYFLHFPSVMEFLQRCQWETCLELRRKTGKGLGLYLHSRRQAHDGEVFQLVLLSCAQFWQALLVGCSVPPTTKKSRHKIKLGFLYGMSTPIPHTKSTTESLSRLCPYSLGKHSTGTSCLPWKPTCFPRKDAVSIHNLTSWKARHECIKWHEIIFIECHYCDIQSSPTRHHWACSVQGTVLNGSGTLQVTRTGLGRAAVLHASRGTSRSGYVTQRPWNCPQS